MSFDLYLFNVIYGAAHHYSFLGWFANFFAKYLIYLLVAVLIIFLVSRYNWRKCLYLFSSGLLSVILSRGIVTELIRFFYHRSRPFIELNLSGIDYPDTGSLPSGHMTFLIPLSLLIWHEDKKLGKWFLISTLLIGLGRIAVGLHWPTDILLGIAVGIASFYLIRKFIPKFSTKAD